MSISFTGPDGREYVWRYPSGLCPHGVFVNDPTFQESCPLCEEEGYPSHPPFIPVLWDYGREREASDQAFVKSSEGEEAGGGEVEEFHPDDVEGWFRDDPVLYWFVVGSLLLMVFVLAICFAIAIVGS